MTVNDDRFLSILMDDGKGWSMIIKIKTRINCDQCWSMMINDDETHDQQWSMRIPDDQWQSILSVDQFLNDLVPWFNIMFRYNLCWAMLQRTQPGHHDVSSQLKWQKYIINIHKSYI